MTNRASLRLVVIRKSLISLSSTAPPPLRCIERDKAAAPTHCRSSVFDLSQEMLLEHRCCGRMLGEEDGTSGLLRTALTAAALNSKNRDDDFHMT
eukprot:CAMPEP_0181290842 /NCGR_PEP_ID=MMETSP1101-20121128/1640_1 /TAXON_ID=46948 /ORGANISM="Rhodomonas abbreviata, Strain Caron Lab Isolate" /LENGTH=94 /DNA_ID=CAMNT_0023395175 /DNA_START=955 /DNA_END=1239 /DNA_ORIENTATION=-